MKIDQYMIMIEVHRIKNFTKMLGNLFLFDSRILHSVIYSDEFVLKQMGDTLILIKHWRLGSYGPLHM